MKKKEGRKEEEKKGEGRKTGDRKVIYAKRERWNKEKKEKAFK